MDAVTTMFFGALGFFSLAIFLVKINGEYHYKPIKYVALSCFFNGLGFFLAALQPKLGLFFGGLIPNILLIVGIFLLQASIMKIINREPPLKLYVFAVLFFLISGEASYWLGFHLLYRTVLLSLIFLISQSQTLYYIFLEIKIKNNPFLKELKLIFYLIIFYNLYNVLRIFFTITLFFDVDSLHAYNVAFFEVFISFSVLLYFLIVNLLVINFFLIYLKRQQEEIRENIRYISSKEKISSLSNVVLRVAHEINTPLGNCITMTTFIEKKMLQVFQSIPEEYQNLDTNKTLIESSAITQKNLNRISELVENFKKMQMPTYSQLNIIFNPYQKINQIFSVFRDEFKEKKVNLKIEIQESLEIKSDPNLFVEIITQLISNSLSHAFSEEKDEANLIAISLKVIEKKIILEYKDNGLGIANDSVDRIFEPFYTKSGSGSTQGIGLTKLHYIITENLKGVIEVKSTLKKGIYFRIILPNQE